MSTDSITKAANHLREIEKLSGWLEDQAANRANDRLMPGGQATAALAYVGSPREWANQVDADELYHLTTCPKPSHRNCRYAEQATIGADDETPLQTLLFWSEQWREEHGYRLERRPTIATEVNLLRGSLSWAWANEVHWNDFVQDLADTQIRLENLLQQGIRSERGVPCMYDECRGIRLVRKLQPRGDGQGGKVWELSKWHCPKCHREWDEDHYRRNIAAAAWNAQREEIDGETWCTVKYAARKVERTESCIRAWVTKHVEWPRICVVKGRRLGFIRLADIEGHAEKAKRRNRAA